MGFQCEAPTVTVMQPYAKHNYFKFAFLKALIPSESVFTNMNVPTTANAADGFLPKTACVAKVGPYHGRYVYTNLSLTFTDTLVLPATGFEPPNHRAKQRPNHYTTMVRNVRWKM